MRAHFVFFTLAILHTPGKSCSCTGTETCIPECSVTHACGIAAVQDQLGFMWFAHVGVYRYDGYKYKSYFNDPLDSNSLAGDWVESLCADHNGFIWIGTRLSGLDRLDPETGHFTHFRHNPKNTNTISGDVIRTILEDREGMLWIGTDSGLNRYDPETGVFHHYNHDPKDPYSLSCDHVFKIYEDRQGTLWVGTGSIWHKEGGETDEGGLNRFDKNTGKFTRYLHEPGNPHSLIDNKVRSIFEDSRGTFWVGTAGDGLHTMNRKNGTFDRLPYNPIHPDKLSRPPVINYDPSKDAIVYITEDITGAIWIGTFHNGVNRYDYRTNKVDYYPNFKDSVSGIQTDFGSWAYNSSDGMLWIGYWEGIFLINPLQHIKSYFYTRAPVYDLLEDTDGMIWYGTQDGLVRKDRNTGTERRFVNDPRSAHSISDNRIYKIYEDRQGVLWIGTVNGLNRFDRGKGGFTSYGVSLNSSTRNSDEVRAIYEDRHGYFWLGTGSGLVLMDRKKASFEHYLYNPEDSVSWGNNSVLSICEDKHDDLWIGCFNGGINKFYSSNKKVSTVP
jgi:ligand-binding sensor domain-containing protein